MTFGFYSFLLSIPSCFASPSHNKSRGKYQAHKILSLIPFQASAMTHTHRSSPTCCLPRAAPDKSKEENKRQRTVRDLLRVAIEWSETFLTTQERHKSLFWAGLRGNMMSPPLLFDLHSLKWLPLLARTAAAATHQVAAAAHSLRPRGLRPRIHRVSTERVR